MVKSEFGYSIALAPPTGGTVGGLRKRVLDNAISRISEGFGICRTLWGFLLFVVTIEKIEMLVILVDVDKSHVPQMAQSLILSGIRVIRLFADRS